MWGEFPPGTQSGISVMNEMVHKYLLENYEQVFVIEECAWGKKSLGKMLYYLKNYVKLIKTVIHHKIRIIYFVLPLSPGGLLKRLLIWPFIKIVSPGIILAGHLHRGDFKKFVNRNIFNRIIVKSNFLFINKVIVLSPLFFPELKSFTTKTEVIVLKNTSPIESSITKMDFTYRKNFVCISNYIETKGLQELVECFKHKELRSLNLTIYGEAYEKAFLNKLKNIASDNVVIDGPVQREELPDILHNYDCLIVPSWNEGQPIIILEAMSSGLPVISTNVGDIPNMLGSEYPFLVEPQDIPSLKKAILAFDVFEEKSNLSLMLYNRYYSYYSNIVFKKQLSEIFM